MKSKYMSRKFIVAIIGLVLAGVAVAMNNTVVALAGVFLAGCFVIGESIIDAHSSVKRTVDITEYREVKDGNKDAVKGN